MKLPLLLFTLCLLTRAKNLKSKTFVDHFQDFKELIYGEVGEDIINLFGKYLKDDRMQRAVAFLENKHNLMDLLERLYEFEEFCDLIQFIEKHGIDHKHFLDLPSDEIEFDRSQTNRLRTTTPQKTGIGYSGYLRDVISLLPRDKLFDLHLEKMKKDLSFRATMQELLSDEFFNLSWELRMTNAFSREMTILRREYDVDLNILIDYWVALLGFPADVKV